jgi:hypothetical protein
MRENERWTICKKVGDQTVPKKAHAAIGNGAQGKAHASTLGNRIKHRGHNNIRRITHIKQLSPPITLTSYTLGLVLSMKWWTSSTSIR